MTTTESTIDGNDSTNGTETFTSAAQTRSSETRPTLEPAPAIRRAKPVALALLALTLGACGGAASNEASGAGAKGGANATGAGATGGTGGTGGGPSASVEETLTRLGVPLGNSRRLGPNGQALADDFDPLGRNPNTVIEKKDELFALGLKIPATNGATFFSLLGGTQPARVGDATGAAPLPWAFGGNGVVRAAAAADVDGDGRQEMVVVSVPSSTEVDLSIIDDAKASVPFATRTAKLASVSNVTGLALAAADFDGDNQLDLAVGVSTSVAVQTGAAGSASVARAGAEVLFFHGNGDGTFTPDPTGTKTLVTASIAGPTDTAFALAPAELDGDGPSELALVVNATYATNGNTTHTAHYYVYDDARSGYAARADGAVGGAGDPAVSADVAAGDVDGDGLDEIVLGGPDAIGIGCVAHIVAVALDDAAHGFAPIGSPHGFSVHWGSCGGEGNNDPTIAWAPVRVLQADADDAKEILVGDVIFDDLGGVTTLPGYPNVDPFRQIASLPGPYISSSNTASNRFNPTTATVVVATAQQSASAPGAADEVIVYTQDSPSRIVSYTPTCAAANGGAPTCTVTAGTPVAVTSSPSDGGATYPILVPVDATGETLVLQRSALSHQLVFTQPLVIAALAAPPCENSVGQNTDACVSSYGVADSHEMSGQKDVSASVGVTAGIHVDGAIFGDFEAKATVTAKATTSTGNAYSLTQQITYSSGAMEDSVVFATVPYDQYHYTVVSGGDIGSTVTVSIPRAPVVMIAERGFYNSTVAPGSLKIDDQVFRHKIGDIASYPKAADEVALAANRAVLVGKNLGAVGQGGGSTTIYDQVDQTSTSATSVEFDAELDVEATAGVVMGGFSVGTGFADTLSVSMTDTTSFSGTVGSIDAGHFGDNFYQFNLFAYTQADAASGQKFQVVNYWVQQ